MSILTFLILYLLLEDLTISKHPIITLDTTDITPDIPMLIRKLSRALNINDMTSLDLLRFKLREILSKQGS